MLTAEEWNERYPPDTPVHFDGQVWTTVGAAGPAAGAEGAWLTLRGCGPSIGPRDVPVDAVEPLATDEQRRAEGWLDGEAATAEGMRLVRENLAETDRLRRERDEAMAERDESRARLNEVSNDRLAQLRRFAIEQPVIAAARAWRHSPQGVGSWPEGRALIDAIDALDTAEAAPC